MFPDDPVSAILVDINPAARPITEIRQNVEVAEQVIDKAVDKALTVEDDNGMTIGDLFKINNLERLFGAGAE